MTVRNAVVGLIVLLGGLFLVLRERSHTVPLVHLQGKVDDHGTRTARPGSTVVMLLEDTSFSPTFIRVSPGSRLTIALHDQGFHAHTFTVPALGIDLTLAPNTSTTVDITVPASGVVVYECRFHQAQGMQGAFVIR